MLAGLPPLASPGFGFSPHRARRRGESGLVFACFQQPPRQTAPVRVLITAGPTREPIDPVRYITNRSSGKMGYAMAGAFQHAGHHVTLISGPTRLDVPHGVDFIQVQTAAEMFDAVRDVIGAVDVAVFSAAVADYTPRRAAPRKLKKSGATLNLELVPTRDILGSARAEFGFRGTLVGFAAETEDLETNARGKLTRKGCDLVIANDVGKPGLGFDSDHNELLLVYPDHSEPVPAAGKDELAWFLVPAITALHAAAHPA